MNLSNPPESVKKILDKYRDDYKERFKDSPEPGASLDGLDSGLIIWSSDCIREFSKTIDWNEDLFNFIKLCWDECIPDYIPLKDQNWDKPFPSHIPLNRDLSENKRKARIIRNIIETVLYSYLETQWFSPDHVFESCRADGPTAAEEERLKKTRALYGKIVFEL